MRSQNTDVSSVPLVASPLGADHVVGPSSTNTSRLGSAFGKRIDRYDSATSVPPNGTHNGMNQLNSLQRGLYHSLQYETTSYF